MADSDHTRIHAAVTRRTALQTTVASIMAVPFQATGARAWAHKPSSDPALALWQDWQAAHHQTDRLCQEQQRLEAMLMRVIGFPRVEIDLPDDDMTVTISHDGEIEELLDGDPSLAKRCAQARVELAAQQARWAEADSAIGYSAARRDELAAADHAQRLVEALAQAPATTLAGVAGKLDMILREGQSSEDCEEFPWRELRLVLIDLQRLGRSLQPGVFMPGRDRTQP